MSGGRLIPDWFHTNEWKAFAIPFMKDLDLANTLPATYDNLMFVADVWDKLAKEIRRRALAELKEKVAEAEKLLEVEVDDGK